MADEFVVCHSIFDTNVSKMSLRYFELRCDLSVRLFFMCDYYFILNGLFCPEKHCLFKMLF